MSLRKTKTKTKTNFTSTKLKKSKSPAAASVPNAMTHKVESDESDSSGDMLSDDENQWKDTKRPVISDPTPDYHNIQKLVKYVKAGNTTATIVSLCCLKDFDLSVSINQVVRIKFSHTFGPFLPLHIYSYMRYMRLTVCL